MLTNCSGRHDGDNAHSSVYYTRCPVPTATGIALATRIFDGLFADIPWTLRDIAELDDEHSDTHYTHSVDRSFREGGGAPPIWARARGADTRLLGVTFMDEMLGIFVRENDPAQNMLDLAGRRIGLPRWPGLAFDFWRFAAEKGFHSALRCHGMRITAVTVVDVVEERDGIGSSGLCAGDAEPGPRRCNYRSQLQALVDGRIDAMFGKGLELASLEREAAGRIRLLFNVASSPEMGDRVNNSTPRLITAGRGLVNEEGEVVVRYLQGLVRAATWASQHSNQTRDFIARECSVEASAVDRFLGFDYARRLMPALTEELLGTVDILKSFLLHHGYLHHDFAVADWIDPQPLRAALLREQEAIS